MTNSQLVQEIQNLSTLLGSGNVLSGEIEIQLDKEKRALTSREIELIESTLKTKQLLQKEFLKLENEINKSFSQIENLIRLNGISARDLIRQHYPQLNQELESFISSITKCRNKGKENEGIVNIGMIQINNFLGILLPQEKSINNNCYSSTPNTATKFSAHAYWVA